MKVTVPQHIPPHQLNPVGKSAVRSETTSATVAPTVQAGYSSQRPVRVSREGEAQALFVYDSLANYPPTQPAPSVDVYV